MKHVITIQLVLIVLIIFCNSGMHWGRGPELTRAATGAKMSSVRPARPVFRSLQNGAWQHRADVAPEARIEAAVVDPDELQRTEEHLSNKASL